MRLRSKKMKLKELDEKCKSALEQFAKKLGYNLYWYSKSVDLWETDSVIGLAQRFDALCKYLNVRVDSSGVEQIEKKK